MEFLRTPDEHFQNLPDYDFEPKYMHVQQARMHYIDTYKGVETILMLHGEPSWCFLYRHMIHALQDTYRCIAPDLLGFGRSDKPAQLADHSFDFHYAALVQFVESLDLQEITLVVQDWGGLLGLPFAAHHKQRIKRLVIMNTGLGTGDIPLGEGFARWQEFARKAGHRIEPGTLIENSAGDKSKITPAIKAAYDAPFPDRNYKAGVAALPLLVPTTPEMGGAELSRQAREIFTTYDKPTLVLFSDQDPVTKGGDRFFRRLIPTAAQEPEITIEGAGHFLQEEAGDAIAAHIREFIQRTNK